MVTTGVETGLLSMELLVNTVQQLSMARDLESVMRIVRKVARELTGADGATFVLREDQFCFYADEDAITPLWKGSRFPINICVSGWAMLNKKPAIIEDIYNDPRVPVDSYRPTFVKSLLTVPIRTIDPIGSIGCYWAQKRMPSKEEVSLLQALADITAVSIENIMVRNTLEEKVLERTRELAESLEREKMLSEKKSTFLSAASHEFRTPLSTILSSVSLAEHYKDEEQLEKRQKHFDRIKSAVKGLMDIQNEFLSVDQLEQGKVETTKEVFNIEKFLQEVAESLDGLRKAGQHFRISHDGGNIVMLDKKILRNVIVNLLSNAIKYSNKDIILNSSVSDHEIKIVVKDSGIGIPKEQQANVFGKYFRASNAREIKGTGLGLNIVRHYVDLLEGTIEFESEENAGTTFSIFIPDHLHKTEIPPSAL
ncbi:MAG: GAF domain-containing sensor histidine kinase [Flavipsychrobacter sp.]